LNVIHGITDREKRPRLVLSASPLIHPQISGTELFQLEGKGGREEEA